MATRTLLLGSLVLALTACGEKLAPRVPPGASPAPPAVEVQQAPLGQTPVPAAAAQPAVAEPAAEAAAERAPGAEVEPAAGAEDYPTEFLSPRNDFECSFTPKGGTGGYMPESGGPELSCDYAGKAKYVRVILGPSGPAKLHTDVLDRHCCGGDYTLPYDGHWALEPFVCELTKKRLQCTRADDGLGFVIDEKGARLISK